MKNLAQDRQLMRTLVVLWGVLAAAGVAAAQSFEGEEEPTVVYHVSGGSFSNDSYDNIQSGSSYKFVLRFRPNNWWDGDRDTTNNDRQRAEVKGLGAHQATNETFEYSSAWRTNRAGSGGFWHVFQLKALDGDNGAPLVTNSIKSGTGAAVQIWSGSSANSSSVRSYSFSLNSFTTTKIRVKVATSTTGELRASINGDALSGKTGIACYRPSATSYRPKWGSYRGVSASSPYGDDTVEQKSFSASKK
jgi:hypothetical protein